MGGAATEALVEYSHPVPGMHVLDLASGTGEPAISLADRVGSDGHVTALDQSADLLHIAEERALQRGYTNFSIRQADAHSLPFPDAQFDLVTSRFGVMFFSEPVRAFREVLRVLKPHGKASFSVWGSFEQPYWSSTMGLVARLIGAPALQSGGPNPFKFAEPGSLSKVFADAGFTDVEEETRSVPWTWPGTPEEVWAQAKAVATPFLPMLSQVPAERWDEINAAVHASIQKYVHGDEINFGAVVVLAAGTKP
jgi:ubiquinone/menaquinone biosynthesis C-methylase UbiE